MTNEVYLKSKKRLVLAIALSVLVCYTLIGSFPDENKILALVLLPFCAMQLWDWIRRSK
jgi:hypothetical protein